MERLSLSQIAAIVDNNGLAEALVNRVHPDDIEDERLRFLWTEIQVLTKLVKDMIAEIPFED